MAVHVVEGRPLSKILLDDHTTHSHAEHGADITLVVELVGRQSPESLSSSRPTYRSKYHVQASRSYLSCTVLLRQAVVSIIRLSCLGIPHALQTHKG